MRRIASALLVLCLANLALAQSTRTKVDFQEARQKLKGLSIIGFYNFANRGDVKLGQETFDAKTNTTFGFGAQYKYNMSQYMTNKAPLSFVGGMVFESPREFQSVNVQGTAFQQSTAAKPSYTMILLQGNLDYQITNEVSAFGGLNFPIPFEQDFGDTNLDGTLGFQGGISMKLAQSVGADIAYRWINITGNNGLNRIDADGLLLQGRYIF